MQDTQLITNSIITEAKADYLSRLSRKLTDPLSSPNIFWSATRRLINSKKITNIPPLQEDSTFVTNFSEKATIFNTYFAHQCTTLENSSSLPHLAFKTDSRISEIPVSTDQIIKIINKITNYEMTIFLLK